MTTLYAVYGASGCGRGIMPLARQQLDNAGLPVEQLVFVDDNAAESRINGHEVMTYRDFIATYAMSRHVVLAIANGEVREQLAAKCRKDGVEPWSVRARNVVMMDQVSIGEGAVLNPFVTLTSNIKIGRHFHANLYSYVEHDCEIGNFVTFAPGVKCNGNVLIEDHVYIGSGAVLRQGEPGSPLVIGRGTIIGMGSVVTKSVPPNSVYAGNPAQALKSRTTVY